MAYFDAVGCAAALYKACKGWGTDEAAVFGNLDRIQTQYDWQAVIDAYARNHKDLKDGDLRSALDSDLTARELNRAKEILARKGIQWYGFAPSASPAAQFQESMMSASPSAGAPARSLTTDGACGALPAQEITFTVPRVVQRTIVEPKVVHRTEMQRKAIPHTVVETIPYEETIMVPEPRKTKGVKEIEVYEVEEVERTLKSVTVEPRTVTKKVTVTRPSVKTIETTELRAEPVQVEKEIKTMVMTPVAEKSSIMDTEVVMHTRQVPVMQAVPKLIITSKTTDSQVVERLVNFLRSSFGDAQALDIVTSTEQRVVVVDEPYEVQREVPRLMDQIRMVPQEKVEMVTVTEIKDVEVPVTKDVIEMVEEEQEIECTEMVETVTETIVREPQLVTRQVTVEDEKVDIVKVPKKVMSHRQVERQELATVEEPVQVPVTEMVTRCVQDHYEETRTLRFDPITGEQIAVYTTSQPQFQQTVPSYSPQPNQSFQQPAPREATTTTHSQPPPQEVYRQGTEPGQSCVPVWVCGSPDQPLPGAGTAMSQNGQTFTIASVGQPQAVSPGHQPPMPFPGQAMQSFGAPPAPAHAAPSQSPMPATNASIAQASQPSHTPSPSPAQVPPMKNLTPEQAQAMMRAEIANARAQAISAQSTK